jgi:hypothetical protein
MNDFSFEHFFLFDDGAIDDACELGVHALDVRVHVLVDFVEILGLEVEVLDLLAEGVLLPLF